MGVDAYTGAFEAVQTIPPTSFSGSVDVALAMAGLAAQMGRSFENNGVNARLTDSYYYGSPRNQAYAMARHAGISITLDDPMVLAIWPKNGYRGGPVQLISPDTGMIGYPSFDAMGIAVRTLYNPNIAFGRRIQVETLTQAQLHGDKATALKNDPVAPARGIWAVFRLDHELDCMVPKGSWFSNIRAVNPQFPMPVAQ